MTRLAILCPGQGGQHPGMFDLALSDPATIAALAGWGMERTAGVAPHALPDSPEALHDNRIAQPLVVAATLAMWQALRADLPTPALAAGYSIGELAAYGVAGALAPADVVSLAAQRAALMDDCVGPDQPHGMLAVSGLEEAALQALLPAGALHIAIDTGEANFIVAGLRHALTELAAACEQRGVHATWLPVKVASHTPLMHAAAVKFRPLLEAATWSEPAFPLLSGTGASAVSQRGQALDALTEQIGTRIRWGACMDAIAEVGVTVALELGPGAALSRMLRDRHPHIEARSASEFRSLAGLVGWLRRRCG
ncbi:acyltransferase domain-containing protein [Noviherbaspirillum sp. L7-7A]|uniref:ACP S-malonyltransferase n=1 Tax=Noviherbaspirillum sp. L7-7A TaxID=2850560 RepID=UPI001C2BCC88|nr:acyltransferase domain-containing protein [Noviherbaspirillum sp. L7-7A]MBV0881326.1 acyltransferase domain-containing protein [Noviherbaspirillum sp. L7-7A]